MLTPGKAIALAHRLVALGVDPDLLVICFSVA
jgi:hypothetical protein